jgi:hypothetical protein
MTYLLANQQDAVQQNERVTGDVEAWNPFAASVKACTSMVGRRSQAFARQLLKCNKSEMVLS